MNSWWAKSFVNDEKIDLLVDDDVVYRGHQNITPRSQHIFRFEATISGINALAESVMSLDHYHEALENLKEAQVDLIGRLWNPPFSFNQKFFCVSILFLLTRSHSLSLTLGSNIRVQRLLYLVLVLRPEVYQRQRRKAGSSDRAVRDAPRRAETGEAEPMAALGGGREREGGGGGGRTARLRDEPTALEAERGGIPELAARGGGREAGRPGELAAALVALGGGEENQA